MLLLPAVMHAQYDSDAVAPVAPSSSTNQQRYTQRGMNNNDPSDTASTSQTDSQGIVYNNVGETDSALSLKVFAFDATHRSVKLYKVYNPLVNPMEATEYDATDRFDGIFYTSLGRAGQSHKSIFPSTVLYTNRKSEPLSAKMDFDFNHLYTNAPHRHFHYQTQMPYTMLSYGSSLNKDYTIGIVHTQNLRPRWNMALNYDLTNSNGTYTNSKIKNNALNLTTNYYSEDARYQVQGTISHHNIEQQENGGVANDTTCWQSSNRSGVPVNMYNATNQWRSIDIAIHQSYNTVRQFEKIKPITVKLHDTVGIDTLYSENSGDSTMVLRPVVEERDSIIRVDTLAANNPGVFNSGVWGMDIKASRLRRNFYDTQASSWFYNLGTIDSTIYYDSTAFVQLSGDIYWTNDAYMSHRWHNPFIVTAGIRPEVSIMTYPSGKRNLGSLNLFANADISLGHLNLKANAEEVTGTNRNGDYRFQASAELKTGASTTLRFAALSEAQSPVQLFYHNEGCYQWDIDEYNKIKQQQLFFHLSHIKADTNKGLLRSVTFNGASTVITDNVWIGSDMQPVQGTESGILIQGEFSAHFKAGWFNIKTHDAVQHSTDIDVVRVPTLTSKNSVFADLYLFKRALHVTVGADIKYHTKYLADAWNPVLATFYRQDDVEVGNYAVVDLWLSLHVKQAIIYLKASHINSIVESNPHYFSIPHHPIEDFGLHWGVVWKFFN